MKPVSKLLSTALLLTVLMTACGSGSSTPENPVPGSDTFKPYSAVTDARSGAFLLQADGSYTIPVRGTLEVALGQKSDTTGQISLPASYQVCSSTSSLSGTAVGTAGKFTLTMNRFDADTYVWLGPAASCTSGATYVGLFIPPLEGECWDGVR